MFKNEYLKLKEKIFKNVFLKNILISASGTIFAQSLGILTTPIITRIYTPEDYGLFSAIFAIVMVLSSIGTLRYEVAIPIERDLNKIFALVKLCLIITFLISIIILLFVFGFYDFIEDFLNIKDSKGLLYLIPFLLLLSSVFKTFSFVNIRLKKFKFISQVKVFQSVSAAIVKISSGFLGFNYLGLIFGYISQEFLGIVAFFHRLRREGFKLFTQKDFSDIKKLAKKYSKFPKYQTPSQLLLSFSQRLPTFFLVSIFSAKDLGYYSLAIGMLSLPINLVGTSVNNVFYSEISEIGTENSEKIYILSLNVLKKLFLIGMLPCIIIFFYGSDIFSFVFGAQWLIAGQLAELLIILILFRFVTSPIMSCLNLYGMQRFQLNINIFRLTILLITFYLVKHFNFNLNTVILVFVTVSCLIYVYQTLVVLKKIKNKNEIHSIY